MITDNISYDSETDREPSFPTNMLDDEKIDRSAARILEKYKKAFLELAK